MADQRHAQIQINHDVQCVSEWMSEIYNLFNRILMGKVKFLPAVSSISNKNKRGEAGTNLY